MNELNGHRSKLIGNSKNRTTLLSLFSINILLSLGATLYLPCLPHIKNALHTTEIKSQLIIIIFVIGSILSRVWWRSISDMLGIRRTFLASIIIQLIAQAFIILAKDIDTLLFWRSIQSLSAGTLALIGPTIISSLAEGNEKKKLLSIYDLSFPVSYSIAPFIGLALLKSTGAWWSGFLFMLLVMAVCGLVFYKFIPDSSKKVQSKKMEPLLGWHINKVLNGRFIAYNIIVGLVLSDNMMFMFTNPCAQMTGMNNALYQFAWFIFIQNISSLFGSLCYHFLASFIGSEKCVNYSIVIFIIMGPVYLYLSCYSHSIWILLTMICCRAFITPFFLPELISKALDINFNYHVFVSSVSIIIRALFMILTTMTCTIILDKNIQQIFAAKFLIVALISILFLMLKAKKIKKTAL